MYIYYIHVLTYHERRKGVQAAEGCAARLVFAFMIQARRHQPLASNLIHLHHHPLDQNPSSKISIYYYMTVSLCMSMPITTTSKSTTTESSPQPTRVTKIYQYIWCFSIAPYNRPPPTPSASISRSMAALSGRSSVLAATNSASP